MATFQFDLVSPEKLLFSGPVDQVDVPGSEGDFGVLAGHAPLMTTLRPGILVLHREAGALSVVVNGGFAEVNPDGLTVLVDLALERDDERWKVAHRLPAPGVEFRLVAAGWMDDVDLAFVAGEAQRVPFLRLPAILALPGLADDLARDVVGEPVLDLAELLD